MESLNPSYLTKIWSSLPYSGRSYTGSWELSFSCWRCNWMGQLIDWPSIASNSSQWPEKLETAMSPGWVCTQQQHQLNYRVCPIWAELWIYATVGAMPQHKRQVFWCMAVCTTGMMELDDGPWCRHWMPHSAIAPHQSLTRLGGEIFAQGPHLPVNKELDSAQGKSQEATAQVYWAYKVVKAHTVASTIKLELPPELTALWVHPTFQVSLV